jgi:protocatechuate 3,4-dioxygenase beta subunit
MSAKNEKAKDTQLTPAVDEGPYYKDGSPTKTKLYQEGIPGERLTLSGQVLDAQGQPIAHAWLDFWQADGEGHYDNEGFRLRGHQQADKSGRYAVETVFPGHYPGRTPHIHVKVQSAPSSPIFTTQLFVPGLASNKTDFLYQDALQMEIKQTPSGKAASFDFRLAN